MNEIEEAIALLEAPLVWSSDFERIRPTLIEILYAANQRIINDVEVKLANLLIEAYDGKA
jgi:hypothetical protein